MKKLLFSAIVATTFLSSCTGKCDTSTAERASQCLCDLMDESVIIDIDDEAKMQEVAEKSTKLNNEIKAAIKEGKYTAEELAKIAGDRGCM